MTAESHDRTAAVVALMQDYVTRLEQFHRLHPTESSLWMALS